MFCYKRKNTFMKRSSRKMETWHSLWPQKVTGSLEFSDLLYDPKGHGALSGWFDLVYDPKRLRGHKRSPWPTSWPQRSRWPLWLVLHSLWPLKVKGSLMVAVTYFSLTIFDNFWQVWQFLTVLTSLTSLTIFDRFDNFWQVWQFLTGLTIFDRFDDFDDFW